MEGQRLGRAPLDIDHDALVRDRLAGMSLTNVAKKYGVSRASVVRFVKEVNEASDGGRLSEAQQTEEPMVGIIYLVGDKLFIDSTPLSGAGHYADHLIHDRGHDEYWSQLVKMGAVPSGGIRRVPTRTHCLQQREWQIHSPR